MPSWRPPRRLSTCPAISTWLRPAAYLSLTPSLTPATPDHSLAEVSPEVVFSVLGSKASWKSQIQDLPHCSVGSGASMLVLG